MRLIGQCQDAVHEEICHYVPGMLEKNRSSTIFCHPKGNHINAL